MFSVNIASMKSKLKNFKNEIKRTNTGLFRLQKTHYATKVKLQIEDMEIFESIRKHKEK